ncbi:MAG TPA: GNAT family N-acetyltransferase [Tepidisphaeraceae bacterium]|nr:GNAT family N-acetyltransferase [Tepidisphaeraceae bacterium]
MSSPMEEDELLRRVRETRRGAFLFPLKDGQRVLLGPVLPEDRERIRAGIKRLSTISRYLRFFAATNTLSEEHLRYLTQVDQVNHVAWCVVDISTPALDGLGLGRFVRLAKQPTIAETALAVVDAYQGRGVGRILLGLLYLRALELGVETLRALILPENERVEWWFGQLGAEVRQGRGNDITEADLPVLHDLGKLPKTPAAGRFREVLERLAAAKAQL